MIGQKIITLSISVVLVTGTLGFDWMETLFPPAEAHGVQAQLQSRFIIIQNETFDRQSLQTGETLTVSGQLVSLVERDLQGWISIFSESTNAENTWDIIAKEPPDNSFSIKGNTVVPYSVSAIALEPGVYHVHTQLNVASVGPGMGPGQTVVVEGYPIIKPKPIPYTDIASYLSIITGVGSVVLSVQPWFMQPWPVIFQVGQILFMLNIIWL